MSQNVVVMKHQVRTRVPSRVQGFGDLTQAQSDAITSTAMAYSAAQIADAQAGLTSASPTTQAALQQWQSVAAAAPAAGVGAPATSSTYYIIAGIVGVAVLGALVYYATE
jgi:hypothetical protein